MFDVVGVIDLRHGDAVRAKGGKRDDYQPIETVAGEAVSRGDARALARCYVERFGLGRMYVADLDAIEGRPPQAAIVRSLIPSAASVWLDAGVASVEDARRALQCGVERVIVGLETLPSFETLESICEHAGPDRVVFSLDLRNGQPIATTCELAQQSPEELAARAADAGVAAVLVLDLARVGSSAGVDLALMTRLRSRISPLSFYVGGGARSIADIEQLQRAGCSGALVATALLDGQITKRDLDLFLDPVLHL